MTPAVKRYTTGIQRRMIPVSGLLLLQLIALLATAQPQADCAQQLNRVPFFVSHRIQDQPDSVKQDFRILMECGGLDSMDLKMLVGPWVAKLMVDAANRKEQVTYQKILNGFDDLKQSGQYEKMKEVLNTASRLETMVISLKTFDKDKAVLRAIGMPDARIEAFKKFVTSQKLEGKTYRTGLEKFMAPEKAAPQTKASVSFYEFKSLDHAVTVAGREKKRAILMFTSRNDANIEKMRRSVFASTAVQQEIARHYMIFSAFIDDTRPVPGGSTVGRYHLSLQREKYGSEDLPGFVVIDDQAKVIGKTGFTASSQAFLKFLRSNRGKK